MLETIETKKESLRRGRGQGGFTLIELLIVIVILAILAAIVVFAVGSTTKNAVAASCSSDAKTVETAISAFQADNPNATTDAGATTSMTTYYSLLTSNANGGPFLRSIPSSTHYTVIFNAAGNVYVVPYTTTVSTAITAENDTATSGGPAVNNFDTNPSICGSFT